jgi:DNA-binding transcriptional MerR regulator
MSETPKTSLIGDIAYLIGTSSSTLRLWEELGIVEPEKDAKNQYRLYTPHDSCRFLFARRYRSFGVPLAEIPAVMASGPAERDSVLEKRKTAMDEEIRRLVAARGALDRYLDECRQARELVGRFVPGLRQAMHYFPFVERGSVRTGRKSLTHEVLRQLPDVDFIVTVDPDRPDGDRPFSCHWGYGLSDAAVAELPAAVRAHASLLPSRRCLVTAIDRKTARDFTVEEFLSLVESLSAIGAELVGPIIGHNLELDGTDGTPLYRVLLFIPIKE